MGKIIISGFEFKFNKVYEGAGETDELKESLFFGNGKLTYIEMENIKVINTWGFRSCSNLHTAIFKNVRVIGEEAFYECYNLKKIEIPNAVSLGVRCFMRTGIESIVLSDEMTEIEDYAFYLCLGLKNVKLPVNLERIGSNAFYPNDKLVITSLPETLEQIGERAFGYTRISINQLPKKINTIPTECFRDCLYLTDLTLGGKGYPVISIGEWAFSSCNNLKKLTIYTTNGQALTGAPWGLYTSEIIYLPA